MNKVTADKNEHSVYVTGEILGQDGKESGGRNKGKERVEEGLGLQRIVYMPREAFRDILPRMRVFRSSKLDS